MSTETYQLAAVARRRIYGEVSAGDFDLFIRRARAEGLLMGEAMDAIATAYARGDFYLLTKDRSRQQDLNHYLAAHARAKG